MRPLMVVAIFSSCLIASGKYLIQDRQVPSYMYHKFVDIQESVFPQDIRINVSLTRASGTLLYSIDSSMNQLIVTLYHSMEVTLVVEFNKQQFGFSLPQLCGCERCQYEVLDLRITLGDSLDLQCNGGTVVRKIYQKDKGLNTDYIIPYTPQPNPSSTKEAQLWMVNNPQYGHIYPNNDQMSGCIFNVFYRGREINFTKISDNVSSECIPTCNGDICNGGRCYETYNGEPVCNCTATFNNGVYCNDTLNPMNLNSTYPHLVFDAFKLSWQSSSRNILVLKNANLEILLYQIDSDLDLEFRTMVDGRSTRYMLYRKYVPNKRYIIIVTFRESHMDIKINRDMTWHHWTLSTGMDVRREVFTSVSLRSGKGNISMAYKTSLTDLYWRNVSLEKYSILEDENAPLRLCPCGGNRSAENGTVQLCQYGGYRASVIIVAVILAPLLVVVAVMTYMILKMRPKRNKRRPTIRASGEQPQEQNAPLISPSPPLEGADTTL